MVNMNGHYGPICDDHWDLAEVSNCWLELNHNLRASKFDVTMLQANVVCKEMGFFGGAEQATKGSHFGNTSAEFAMDDLRRFQGYVFSSGRLQEEI